MTPMQIVCAVLVQLIWGYQYVVFKMGVAEFPPLFFLALRFVAIALLLIPFVPRPTRREVGPIIAISVFLSGLNFGLFYTGLALGTGTMTAVAYQLASPFIILLAWPMLGDRPSLRDVRRPARFGRRRSGGRRNSRFDKFDRSAARGMRSADVCRGQCPDQALWPVRSPNADGVDVSLHRAPGHARFVHLRTRAVGVAGDGGCTWLDNTGLYRCARRHWRVWPMVLAHCPLLNRPGGAVRPADARVRRGFERVVPRRTADRAVGRRRAGLSSRGGHHPVETKGPTLRISHAGRCCRRSSGAQVDLPMRRYDFARSDRPIRREDSAKTSV